jgi:hypothetical protein
VTAQIRVPDRLLQLERDMRRSCNRRDREAKSRDVAACKGGAIYTSTLPVANAPQKAKESGSTWSDSSEDSSNEDEKGMRVPTTRSP